MAIPRDKLMHLAVGMAAAALALVLWHLAMNVPLLVAHPLPTAFSIGGALLGASKEAQDRLDNLLMYHRGEAPLHGVEWLDLAFTWAGCTAIGLFAEALGLA